MRSRRAAIQPERIRLDLVKLARIGATAEGGVDRLTLSRQDLSARQLLLHLMQGAGLGARIDGIGNLFGRLEGRVPSEGSSSGVLPIWIGSHIDSVPGGGKFDGSVGVVIALEVARALREAGTRLPGPVEVVVFVAEESSRFGLATIGSGVVAGAFSPGHLFGLKDTKGHRLGDVLAIQGLDADTVASARRERGEIGAFLEVHIEQGRVLESEGLKLGIATAIAGATRLQVTFTGRADHSGATPMSLRRDALVAAAHLTTFVEETCRATEPPVVGTVGVLKVSPGALNVVPGRAEMGIDLRSTSARAKGKISQEVISFSRELAERRGLRVETQVLADGEPVEMSPRLVRLLEEVSQEAGHAYRLMPSGAGHDAMQIARITDAGLLLIPSREGISHNPAEWSDLEDIVRAAEVVLEAVRRLAG